MKQIFFHGLNSGLLAGLAAIVYNSAYTEAMLVDFSTVINPTSVMGACLFGCTLASLGYWALGKMIKKPLARDLIFNALFLVLSFGSFASSFAFELPLEVEYPELFPGLSVPLHLFPALFWLATKPLFYPKEVAN